MAQTKTIYLVDDDDDDREFMKAALCSTIDNVEIVEVPRVTELISLLEAEQQIIGPKLILMDLNMPRINGMEMLVEIKQSTNHRHIPVVMVSTTTHQQQIDEAYARGANAFVVKPVTSAEYETVARGVGLCFLNHYRGEAPGALQARPKIKTIVVVEDNDDHWHLMSVALRNCMEEYNIIRIDQSDRMMEFLASELTVVQPPVDLFLVDLYLPDREDGLTLIRQIRESTKDKDFRNIPIIVFSYSDDAQGH